MHELKHVLLYFHVDVFGIKVLKEFVVHIIEKPFLTSRVVQIFLAVSIYLILIFQKSQ